MNHSGLLGTSGRSVLAALALAVALGAPAAASSLVAAPALAKTSHAHLWGNKDMTVLCGYRRTSSKPATQLLCSAQGIPRPKGSKGCDAGFVVLGAKGKPQPIVTCQREVPGGTPKTLDNGSGWSGLGIHCTVGKTVRCTNKSSHGFAIGNGKYKHF